MSNENTKESLRVIGSWISVLPISKKQYFIHSILFIDAILIVFRNSYEPLIPSYVSIGLISFDLVVAFIWLIDLISKLSKTEDKINYAQTRWYKFVGLIPIPFFRFFLLLATAKLIIIIYKYIKRGEHNKEQFIDREMNFSFFNYFVDSISDAIFLNSLSRVEEVTRRVDFSKVSREIMLVHKEELKEAVENSLLSMKAVRTLNSIPMLSGLTKELTDDITQLIINTMELEIAGKILKETNLYMLKEMEKHVKELDLDRIVSENDIK
ncbi:MAG: hypothetical protein SFU98_17835 [Leptospiraceae bacterium]|nr:hypothetical protein [Leptospiraceae bacterium]